MLLHHVILVKLCVVTFLLQFTFHYINWKNFHYDFHYSVTYLLLLHPSILLHFTMSLYNCFWCSCWQQDSYPRGWKVFRVIKNIFACPGLILNLKSFQRVTGMQYWGSEVGKRGVNHISMYRLNLKFKIFIELLVGNIGGSIILPCSS